MAAIRCLRPIGCATALLISGCDDLFGLRPLERPIDGPTFDTDGDGLSDSDDNCPELANIHQDDFDGDGIGDACDPHPQTPDVLIDLSLFHGSTGRWLEQPDSGWTIGEGMLTSPAGGALVFDSLQDLTNPTLQIGFSFVDFGERTDASNNEITLELDDGHGTDCIAREDKVGDALSYLLVHPTGAPDPVIKAITPELSTATPYEMVYSRGTVSTCTVAGAAIADVPDASSPTVATTPTIRMNRAAVTFTFIALYAQP